MAITPLETRYAGHRFRSRLEARWAVFFDTLGVPWQYEIEGYKVGDNTYLPDFYLPQSKTWVEVKGAEEDFLFKGALYAEAAAGALPDTLGAWGTERGLLVLGPIPRIEHGDTLPLHTLIQHEGAKELRRSFAAFHSQKSLQTVATWSSTANAPALPPRRQIPYTATSLYIGADVMDHAARAYIAASSARFEHGERG